MDFTFLKKNMIFYHLNCNKIINLDLIVSFLKVPLKIFVNKKNITQHYNANIDFIKNRFLLNPMFSDRLIQKRLCWKSNIISKTKQRIYEKVFIRCLCPSF